MKFFHRRLLYSAGMFSTGGMFGSGSLLDERQKNVMQAVTPGLSEAVARGPVLNIGRMDSTEIALGAQRLLLDRKHTPIDHSKHRNFRRKGREEVPRWRYLEFIRWSRVAHDIYLPTVQNFQRSQGLEERSILKANLQPHESHHPGFVLYRHFKAKKLVLALRANEPVSKFLLGDERTKTESFLDSYGHSQTVQASNALYNLLHDYILEFKSDHPDYDVVITGHSLGGAVAALLALKLKEEVPGIQCYTFGCPPVCSPELATQSVGVVYNVVLNQDLIPRSCSRGYDRLLSEIEFTMEPIRKSLQETGKCKSGEFRQLLGQSVEDKDLAKTLMSLQRERGTILELEKTFEWAQKKQSKLESSERKQLQIPGRVYLVTRATQINGNMNNKNDHQFDLSVEDPDELARVFLADHCLEDHAIARYEDHLQFAFHQLYQGSAGRVPDLVDDSIETLNVGMAGGFLWMQ